MVLTLLGTRQLDVLYERYMFDPIGLSNRSGYNLEVDLTQIDLDPILSRIEIGYFAPFTGLGVKSSVVKAVIEEANDPTSVTILLGREVENNPAVEFWVRRVPLFQTPTRLPITTCQLSIDPNEDFRF